MAVENIKIRVNDRDTVSGILSAPGRTPAAAGVVIAHGAGADMHTPLIRFLADGLYAAGYATLRFNFPYKEKGRKAPDPPSKLVDTGMAAYQYFMDAVKPRKVIVAGKSMGGRIVSQMAGDRLLNPDGLVFYGYPLHPPGKKDRLRDAHLYAIKAPMLFFSGTRDSLCDLNLLHPVLEKLHRADLVVIEGGDHSFRLLKRAGIPEREVFDRLLKETTAWLDAQNY